MNSFLIIVVLFSVLVNFLVIFLCREITFFSRHMMADNEKILSYAKDFSFNKWPSSVREKGSRIQNKEFWFLTLSLLCRFFKNPQKEIVNVSLALISNIANTILIYFIILNIFNEKIAIICSLFYLTSFWSYQVSIYFGHIVYSTMWFLVSILLITLINTDNYYSIFIFTFFAGVTTFICFTSSSSSRKYPPIILLFLFLSLSNFIEFQQKTLEDYFLPLVLLIFFIFVFKYTSDISSKKIINFFIKKKYTTVENFEDHSSRMKKFIFYSKILFIIFILFSIFFTKSYLFFLSFVTFMFGCFLISLYVLLPNIPKSLITYASFLNIGKWASHFKAYPKNFFGEDEDKKFKRASLAWLPKAFFRISPVIFVLFLFSVFYIFLNLNNNFTFLISSLIFIFLPTLISEITGSLRVAKSYFPSFMGFILAIGCALNLLEINYNLNHNNNLIYFIYSFILLNLIINSYLFFKDILPSRLFQVKLKKYLNSRKINKFSTYNTDFNNSTILPMLDAFKNFEVEYVNTLKDSKNNIFIVPPISAKALFMETEKEAIENGDFKSDKILNKLMEKNLIKNYVEKEFKTMGSSKIWVLESEVTGFRDLNLNDINDHDRWLGMCRIINLKELKKINFVI